MVSPLGFEELKMSRFWLCLLTEIIGTALLINIVGGSGIMGHDNVQTSLCAGFSVAVIVWCICHVSGGCINPAVPVAFFVTRKMSLTRAVFYAVSECFGGVLGAATIYITAPYYINNPLPTNKTVNPLDKVPRPDMAWFQIVSVEMIITFFLLLTVFATVDRRRPGLVANDASAVIIIGLAVSAGHFWAGPLTGGVMNPAAAFGSAVVSRNWKFQWAYWLGEMSGAVTAGLLYELLLAANASKAKVKAFFTRYDYDDSQFDEKGRITDAASNTQNEKHELALVDKHSG